MCSTGTYMDDLKWEGLHAKRAHMHTLWWLGIAEAIGTACRYFDYHIFAMKILKYLSSAMLVLSVGSVWFHSKKKSCVSDEVHFIDGNCKVAVRLISSVISGITDIFHLHWGWTADAQSTCCFNETQQQQ